MEDWQVQKLIQENRELRERVFKLEEQLGLDRRQLERETSQVTQVVNSGAE